MNLTLPCSAECHWNIMDSKSIHSMTPRKRYQSLSLVHMNLVILDIKMPKMDGFELYYEIKKKDNNAKVCFLTASELYYEEFRTNEYDALDKKLFIRKPTDNEELLKEVNKMMSST